MMLTTYHVNLTMDAEAETAHQAASQVSLLIQQRPTKMTFDVHGDDGSKELVVIEREDDLEIPLDLVHAPHLLTVMRAIRALDGAIVAAMNVTGLPLTDLNLRLVALTRDSLQALYDDFSSQPEKDWVTRAIELIGH